MRKNLTLATILLLAFASSAFALGEARITGKVLDAGGKPLEGVTISISAVSGKNVKQSTKTNKKGEFAAFLLDGTLRYKFIFAKDGFTSYEEEMKLKLVPEKNVKTVTLNVAGAAAAGTPIAGEPAKPADPSIGLFNEGVTFANEGKVDEAIAKIEEAIAVRADLAAGYSVLTKLYGRKGNWKKAIERGTKALEFDPADAAVLTILAEAYEKTGDKAKGAEFRKKAPANPVALFNEAARLINGSKDSEAEPLLKQAISLDEAFAAGHYELGMLYARATKNKEAKMHLMKYLELEPKGKDAALAKEMLGYVQ